MAMFLSYLGDVSQKELFTDLARRALKNIDLKLLAGSSHLPIGAFDGVSGVIYLLTHLGCLWSDEELLAKAVTLACEIEGRIKHDRSFDVLSGSAGALACILALNKVVPSDQLLNTAIQLGKHLVNNAERRGGGYAWMTHIPAIAPLTGFSHGASGIGWSLLELANLTGSSQYREAGLAAFQYERSCYSRQAGNWPDYRQFGSAPRRSQNSDNSFELGWCHGAPGITLSRLRALQYVDCKDLRADIATGLETTLRAGFGGNHCLCHGDIGNVEVLTLATEILNDSRWGVEAERIVASIIRCGDTHGWYSGTPLGVESPGLMTGLSGIGYGLLRSRCKGRLPSVLTLEGPGNS